MNRPFPLMLGSALLFIAATTSACSGNDDEPEELGSPTLSLELSPIKQLELSWDPVAGATSYQLFTRRGDNGEPTAIGEETEELAATLELGLHQQSGVGYLLRACDATRCRDSDTLTLASDELAAGIGYLKASSPRSGARFGSSVAMSADGSRLAVGAPQESSDTGSVYLFARDSAGQWTEEARVTASNAGEGDYFGYSLAFDPSGEFVLVGAPEEDGGEDGNATRSDSGAAYLFARGESEPETGLAGWSELAYIKAPSYAAGTLKVNDRFGEAVDLDEGAATLAIGASKEGQAGGSGAVYLFDASAEGWEHVVTLKAPIPDEDDAFGASVSIAANGDLLAVGAPFEDSEAQGVGGDASSDALTDSGAAYVFQREITESGEREWDKEAAYLKASNANADANFGRVSLDAAGTHLAVGAPTPEGVGSAYVFELDGEGAWSEALAIVDPGPEGIRDQFGLALALSGDGRTLVVAAPEDDSGARGVDGDEADNSEFKAGAARVFTAPGGQWSAGASEAVGVYLKASNSEGNDELGRAVAISDDGQTLALGAIGEDGNAAGVGGDASDNGRGNAGAVYLY